jgi:hypothetical protein
MLYQFDGKCKVIAMDVSSTPNFVVNYGLSILFFSDIEFKNCIKCDVFYEKIDGDTEVSEHKKSNEMYCFCDRQVRYGHANEILNLIKELK